MCFAQAFLTYNVMCQAFEHGCKVCFVFSSNVHYAFVWFGFCFVRLVSLFFFKTFLHLYCSAQLSMPNMEKHYRNRIIIIIIVI